MKKIKSLKKELGLLDVYAIATGTTLSSGLFLLPGIAALQAGPAITLAYLIATIPLIPSVFSVVELSTAMPRAGGVYYFLDRTMGPLMGTIGGIGTWLALILKVAFALVGMGAYLGIFFPSLHITPIAITLAVAMGILSIVGAKKSGGLQILLVIGLVLILTAFIVGGLYHLEPGHFSGYLDAGSSSIMSAAGLVYISYVGVTKIASLSEEVKDPERNLPLGVFLAVGTAILVYALGTMVMVGILPLNQLAGDLTPVASTAGAVFGNPGRIVVTVAAILAFISVANAGTLSASRYPLAMSRDHIMPVLFRSLRAQGSPVNSIALTVGVIILTLLLFDPTKIAKLASAFQLLMFALVCLAVIVMRESRIDSYDPGYKSPFYPWMQLIGIGSSLVLIIEMGQLTLFFSLGLLTASTLWYFYYARSRVVRAGAIYHVFERLGRRRFEGLNQELRGILKEKGLRKGDPYDQIIARAKVIDLERTTNFETVVKDVARWLARMVPFPAEEIERQFLNGTKVGATPVTHGTALPHLRIEGLTDPEMVLVRGKAGVRIQFNNPLSNSEEEETTTVRAIFFLVSPEKDPTQHLRMLARIASRVEDEDFATAWNHAQTAQELIEALLRDDNFLSLSVDGRGRAADLISKAVREVDIPDGCLIAMITRAGQAITPRGNTIFREGDRLTIIGDTGGMRELRQRYLHAHSDNKG